MMLHLGKWTAAFGAVFFLVGPVLAQGRGLSGPVMLLRNSSVQKELKLTDDQIEKTQEVLREVLANHKEELQNLQGLSREEQQKKGLALRATIGKEVMKGVADVLKPEQMKRLRQIELQQRGPRVFADPEVQKALKLTDEQKATVKSTLEAADRKVRAIGEENRDDRREAAKRIGALRKQTMDKFTGLLDAGQMKAWKELIGQPFELRFDEGSDRRPDGSPTKRKPTR